MHSALGIKCHSVGNRINHRRGTNRGECLPLRNNACPNRCRRVVPRTANHNRACRKSCQRRRLLMHLAGYILRFIHLAKQSFFNAKSLQNFIRPCPLCNVHQLHAGGIGNLRGIFARQLIPNIVLRQKDMRAFCVQLRLMLFHPEDFCRRKAGYRRVRRNLNDFFRTQHTVHILDLFARSLVAPDNRAAQHLAVFIQHNQSVHLSGKPNALDICHIHAGGLQHRLHTLHYCVPPVLRLLLCPTVLLLI